MPASLEHPYYPANRFHKKMEKYVEEYAEYLLLVKSDGTSVSYREYLYEFINYIFGHHLISDISQITVSMTNSKFYNDYKKRYDEKISQATMKKILKGFFTFLYGKHGIRNEKLMKGFDRKKNKKKNALH